MIEIDDSGRRQQYSTREAQERAAAVKSLDPSIRALHLALAARYAVKASGLK